MPDEPNKKMDEMLRAYAEERRKAPEHPLHQATRNLLQAEVRRVFPEQAKPRSWIEKLRSFWPQIAFGGSLCVIFGIAVLSLRQPPREQEEDRLRQLTAPPAVPAETVPASPEQAAPQAAPKLNTVLQRASEPELKKELREVEVSRQKTSSRLAPKPSQERVALRDENVAVEALAEDNLALSSAPKAGIEKAGAQPQALDSAAVPATSSGLAVKQESPLRASSQATVLTTVQAPSPTRPSLDSPTRNLRSSAPQQSEFYSKTRLNESVTNLGAARRLHFVQQATTELAPRAQTVSAVATKPVLQTFEVEQLGREVRVLDGDGSIYLGVLDPQATPALVTAKDQSVRFGTTGAAPTNAAVFNISLRGTNKTLGADVTLTGLFYEKTNEPRSSLDSFSITPTAQKPVQASANTPSHVIIGNAVVGATNQFNFRAVSLEKP